MPPVAPPDAPPEPPSPDIRDAYPDIQRVLLPVLASLASRGYPTGDGLDLLHGFVAYEWGRVARTFDSDRGAWSPYCRRAFELYARRQILRQRRYRERLLDPDSIAQAVASTPDIERSADLGRLRSALADLPNEERAAVDSFLSHGSERGAAAALGITRHRLRSDLASGVARIALVLGPPPSIPLDDWALTRAVLAHGRSPSNAARVLGRDPAGASRTHRNTLALLLSTLRA